MSEVRVPDIGELTDVPVIEIHVAAGDKVAAEDALVTLESDKATMDVPAPFDGVIEQLRVAVGDRVSEGSVLLSIKPDDGPDDDQNADQNADRPEAESAPSGREDAPASGSEASTETAAPRPPGPGGSEPDAQVLVLGAGPGGYTAAFRAADLGLRTVLVERHERLGGVCLNVGCIPSKTMLHAARVLADAEEMATRGIRFGKPEIDISALISWKQTVVDRLTQGLVGLSRQRKIEVVRGLARFDGPHAIRVGGRTLTFENCIIAAGSRAATLPDLPDDPRVIDSTDALSPPDVPRRLLVIGGGIIGLEMATVYDALGSRVTVVEMLDQLIPGCDPDLVKPLQQRIEARYEAIRLGTSVEAVKAQKNGIRVEFSGNEAKVFDRVLVAIGRRPNGGTLNAGAAGVTVQSDDFISVDRQMRTNVPWIYAIGDIVGGPMLAHKASHEGKVAAEVIAGHDVQFDARTIPSVAYTDPEVAWMGLTEAEARAREIPYEKAVFPWAASGRALSLGRDDGLTKLLVAPGTRQVLGAGIVGVNAGELISEAVHAFEMGADAEDLALTVHPHPTLSETVGFAAELATGTITDLIPPRRARA